MGRRADGAAGGELVPFVVSVSDTVPISSDACHEMAAGQNARRDSLRAAGVFVCGQQSASLPEQAFGVGEKDMAAGMGNLFLLLYMGICVCDGRTARKKKEDKKNSFLSARGASWNGDGNYVLQMAYNYPFTVLLSLLLFGAGVFSRDLPGNSGEEAAPAKEGGFPWGRAGEISFAVYLIHPVFLNLFYKFFHITPLDYPLGIALPVFFAGTLLLAAAASLLLRRLPLFKKYVL